MQNWLSIIGSSLVVHLPMILVIGVGIFFCFSNLQKHPKAARTALIGLFILLFVHFIGIFLPAIYTWISLSMRGNWTAYGFITIISGFIVSLIGAVGLGLVIYAVWKEREPR